MARQCPVSTKISAEAHAALLDMVREGGFASLAALARSLLEAIVEDEKAAQAGVESEEGVRYPDRGG